MRFFLSILLSLCAGIASAQAIATDKPLFIFAAPEIDGDASIPQRSDVIDAWTGLSDSLKLNSVMAVPIRLGDQTEAASAQTLFTGLDAARVQSFAHLDMAHPAQAWDPAYVDEALSGTGVKGVVVSGLRFNTYPRHAGPSDIVASPEARWLEEIILICASANRRCVLVLGELSWLRIMAMDHLSGVYRAIVDNPNSVVPIAPLADVHAPGNVASATGIWASGGVNHWGVACGMGGMRASSYLHGARQANERTYDAIVPAAITFGALNGACVYVFDDPGALWYRDEASWNANVIPSLQRIVDHAFITPRDAWLSHVKVAYRAEVCGDAEAFRLMLRDLDPVIAEGHLIRAIHRNEMPDRYPDFIPNRANWSPVPVLPPGAEETSIATTVKPGMMASAAEWSSLIARMYGPAGPPNAAFSTVVGGTRYSLNTDESGAAVQTIHEPIPAPVRNVSAENVDAGVRISWTRRLDDFSYTVYRRPSPEQAFEILALDITDAAYVDASPIPGASYTVNSITAAKEQGVVALGAGEAFITRPGESIAVFEARLEENGAVSRVRSAQRLIRSEAETAGNVPEGIRGVLNDLADAIARSDLDGAMNLFSRDYQDPQGWNHEYVRRALQLMLERGEHPRFDYDIRLASASDSAARINAYVRVSASIASPHVDRRMYTPATSDSVTWITFEDFGSAWRITSSNPAMVNMADITAFIAGDPMGAGLTQPDRYRGSR